MKTLYFSQPKQVFSVWHYHQVYDKTTYHALDFNPAFRKENTWEYQTSEYVSKDSLFVSEQFAEDPDFQKRNVIMLDYVASESTRQVWKTKFYLANWFMIIQKEDQYWLRLIDSDPVFHGYPHRPGFEVAPLLPSKPVRVLLNSKIWHTFSEGWQETEYYEWDFVYTCLGSFGSCAVQENATWQRQKIEKIKVVDLRKKLY